MNSKTKCCLAHFDFGSLSSGSLLMLNGKLKSHFELWDALLNVEKMLETTDDEVADAETTMHFACNLATNKHT